MQLGPLQLYLSLLTAREEVIFMVRVFSQQMQHLQKQVIGSMREVQDEIYKGEFKRDHIENQLFQTLNEGHRKIFLSKIVSKSQKLNAFYLSKTQVYYTIYQTYFPKQGQLLCSESINQVNLRSQLAGMSAESLQAILRYVSGLQKQKLRHELSRVSLIEKEERCNRNEKFFTETLLIGIRGFRYLNEIHRKYFYTQHLRCPRNCFDILLVDEITRDRLILGGGFRCSVSSLSKKTQQQESVYVPVETTVEIITQRYEKLMKDFMDNNYAVQRSLRKYAEQYDRYKLRKSRRNSGQRNIKISTRQSITQLNTQKMQLHLVSKEPLTDNGRYSEPLYKNTTIGLECINTVRNLRLKIPYKNKKDTSILREGVCSPVHNLTESLPITTNNLSISSSIKLQKIKSVRPSNIQLMKNALLSPSCESKPLFRIIMNFIQNATFHIVQKFGYEPQEEARKLFDQAFHQESTVLPVSLLDRIAELSFDIDHYSLIVACIMQGITENVTKDEDILKTLSIIDYLFKYGCSAIIDDMKNKVHIFRRLAEFKDQNNETIVLLSTQLYIKVRKKSDHIAHQLINRKLLYREKEIARSIKMKLQVNKQKQTSGQSNDQQIDDFLENYLFKYLDRVNDKLDEWGDSINAKLDALIEQAMIEDQPRSEEFYFPESCMEEIQISHKENLDLQFQTHKVQPNAQIQLPNQPKKIVNLIDFD